MFTNEFAKLCATQNKTPAEVLKKMDYTPEALAYWLMSERMGATNSESWQNIISRAAKYFNVSIEALNTRDPEPENQAITGKTAQIFLRHVIECALDRKQTVQYILDELELDGGLKAEWETGKVMSDDARLVAYYCGYDLDAFLSERYVVTKRYTYLGKGANKGASASKGIEQTQEEPVEEINLADEPNVYEGEILKVLYAFANAKQPMSIPEFAGKLHMHAGMVECLIRCPGLYFESTTLLRDIRAMFSRREVKLITAEMNRLANILD